MSMQEQIDSLWAHVTGLALKALPREEYGDYIDPKDATFIRIFPEWDGSSWYLDAGDDLGKCTEACWTGDTKAQVQNLVDGFCEAYGIDPELPTVYPLDKEMGIPSS